MDTPTTLLYKDLTDTQRKMLNFAIMALVWNSCPSDYIRSVDSIAKHMGISKRDYGHMVQHGTLSEKKMATMKYKRIDERVLDGKVLLLTEKHYTEHQETFDFFFTERRKDDKGKPIRRYLTSGYRASFMGYVRAIHDYYNSDIEDKPQTEENEDLWKVVAQLWYISRNSRVSNEFNAIVEYMKKEPSLSLIDKLTLDELKVFVGNLGSYLDLARACYSIKEYKRRHTG